MPFLRFFLLFLLCASKAWSLDIVSSINPVHQIVSAIAGDNHLIIKPNVSEHDYQLRKSDISALMKADLIFYVDDSLEKNFPKLIESYQLKHKSYQLSKVKGIRIWLDRNNTKKLDPHLWLDPENGIKIAEFVAEKLCELNKKECWKYRKNFLSFKQKIRKAEIAIHSDLKGFDSKYAIYHDAYQYFENFFGIKAEKIISEQLKASSLRGLEEVKCIVGEKLDEGNAARNLAKNRQMKFVILDVIGGEDVFYEDLLRGVARGFRECRN